MRTPTLSKPVAVGTPPRTSAFTKRAAHSLPDPSPLQLDPGSAPPATGSARLCSARPSPGWLPAPCSAARVLWRGAPCPASAELRPRRRGAAGARAGVCRGGPGMGRGGYGVLLGRVSRLRAGEPESRPFLKGSVASNLQPHAREALVPEGLPAQLVLSISAADKRRGGANAR